MEAGTWLWFGFLALIAAMLALDLGVVNRRDHVVRAREALAWSSAWIALALGFAAAVWAVQGRDVGLQFLTGYVIEKSLSVDNIFVFVVLFGALGIPPLYQHRVLFWGILSAVVLRGAMILAGAAVLARHHWILYGFAALLVASGIKLLRSGGAAHDPSRSAPHRALRRVLPSARGLDGNRFFTREDGRRVATPLFFALVLVEVSDVVFAVDSIPAVFAVTDDPFIVFTSNIFAILGMRSLYFLVAGSVQRFRYLRPSLSVILIFVGVKMAIAEHVALSPVVSLVVILGVLTLGIGASVLRWRASPIPAARTPHATLQPSKR